MGSNYVYVDKKDWGLMAKNPGPGICIHCCKKATQRNWDHVIPAAWYSDTTPRDLEKWKIPSCLRCNSEYGKLENDLLLRLALCLDPNELQNSGISKRVLRSIDPACAANEKDRRARAAKRKQIQAEAFGVGPEVQGALPGFGSKKGFESGLAIPISVDALHKLGEKFVRGITYLETGQTISDKYRIKIYYLHEADSGGPDEVMKTHAIKKSRGPGVVVERVQLDSDPVQGLFRVTIWDRFRLFASVRD